MTIDVGLATIFSACIGVVGSKIVDVVRWKLGKVPNTFPEFRSYAQQEISALKGQLKYQGRLIDSLRHHVDDCEKDRSRLASRVTQLEIENDSLRRKLGVLEARS